MHTFMIRRHEGSYIISFFICFPIFFYFRFLVIIDINPAIIIIIRFISSALRRDLSLLRKAYGQRTTLEGHFRSVALVSS